MANFRYLLIHKPVNVLSSKVDSCITQRITDRKSPLYGQKLGGAARKTLYDIVQEAGFPTDMGEVGRLDYETSGLIMMTDDSKMLRGIIDPVPELENSIYHSKEYILGLQGQIAMDDAKIIKLSQPLEFKRENRDFKTNSAEVQYECTREINGEIVTFVRITLCEGKHHQIRRLCFRSGLHLLSLQRVKLCSILNIESVPEPGQCRWLTTKEVQILRKELLNEEFELKTYIKNLFKRIFILYYHFQNLRNQKNENYLVTTNLISLKNNLLEQFSMRDVFNLEFLKRTVLILLYLFLARNYKYKGIILSIIIQGIVRNSKPQQKRSPNHRRILFLKRKLRSIEKTQEIQNKGDFLDVQQEWKLKDAQLYKQELDELLQKETP